MSETSQSHDSESGHTEDYQHCLPAGFRSGVITAITVVLGFSYFFSDRGFLNCRGEWTASSIFAASLLIVAIIVELIALWRSLQPEDEIPERYRLTLRWFIAATIILLLSLITAAFSYAHVHG